MNLGLFLARLSQVALTAVVVFSAFPASAQQKWNLSQECLVGTVSWHDNFDGSWGPDIGEVGCIGGTATLHNVANHWLIDFALRTQMYGGASGFDFHDFGVVNDNFGGTPISSNLPSSGWTWDLTTMYGWAGSGYTPSQYVPSSVFLSVHWQPAVIPPDPYYWPGDYEGSIVLKATATPEPSTIVLTTIGVIGIGLVGNRRRRTA